MSFAAKLEKHVARLGIAESCAELEITRRTLEQWRAGREPRQIIQRGALAILSEARPKTKKAAPGRTNIAGLPRAGNAATPTPSTQSNP